MTVTEMKLFLKTGNNFLSNVEMLKSIFPVLCFSFKNEKPVPSHPSMFN